MSQGFELGQSDSTSYPKLGPTPTQGTQMSREALEDLAAPPQLRGGALGWKPRVGSARCGGAGGFPAEAFAPARLPCAPSQAQEAQRPWPNSWAGKELSGETHPREKLL